MSGSIGNPRTWTARQAAGIAAAAVVIVLALGWVGWSATCPCDFTPGSHLFGSVNDEPVSDWTFANRVTLCQIQIRTGLLPHAINLNCFANTEGNLYLSCSNCDGKRWSGIAAADGWARLRLDGTATRQATREPRPGRARHAWRALDKPIAWRSRPTRPPPSLAPADGCGTFRVRCRAPDEGGWSPRPGRPAARPR